MNRKTAAVRGLLLLAAALALLSMLSCMAQADPSPVLAPANPALTSYMEDSYTRIMSAADSGYVGGLIPEPFDLSSVKPPAFSSMAVASPLSYDLRPLNKLTGIRDQGSCGSCWDFAAIGSLESSLMPAESCDFSENNLKNLAGFAYDCCSGGNRTMSTAYLARWGGAIAQSDDRYSASTCTSPAGLVPIKHVQDVIFLPNRSGPLDNEFIKQAVMTYGAVYTTYYHSNTYYNSVTASYYLPSGSQSNHAVCVVGWDDNYPSSKFLVTPPGNGAFLIRNSWGTWWGMSGYFWMSYYDATMGKSENAVYRAESNTNYGQIYQYDPLGWISSTGYGSNTAWFANVFTTTSTSAVAAASWYTPVANSTYTLYVYTDPTSGPINSAGPAGSVTGTLDTAGYHTVQLPSAVPISAGQKFSVVVKLNTPGYSYPICLERPYSGYAPSATASTGQSYMSSSGTSWTDVTSYYANTNVCLKAFTSGSGTPPPPTPGALSVTPATGLTATGTVGGPFAPASQAYTLTNTGASAINWTASDDQTWAALSSTNGTLAAGATTTVTASINSSANSLAAGTYTGSVAFTNTTNGNGNATRSISLTVNAAPAAGALSVTPSTGLTSSGNVGGPFGPSSQAYSLTNTGSSAINWTAGATKAWVGLSATSGTLAAGATTTVTASINSSANTLAAGTYTDSVTFTNTTNGSGNATRSVSLTVNPAPAAGVLSMTPSTGLTSSGNVGGPFSPSSQAYSLTNTGSSAINWTANSAEPWVGLSSTTGSLAAGATTTVTISINSSANALSAGTYGAIVSFVNTTNGAGNTTRSVSLTVLAAPPPPSTGAYQILPTTYSWIDPTYHAQIPLSDDSVSAARSLPFAFTFYGKRYSAIYVGSNGLAGFSSTGMTNYLNVDIPSATGPNAAIYPFWDDLNPSLGGSVRMATVGTAPNRKAVISWVTISSARNSAARFTFQMILCEGTNDIVFQYRSVASTIATYGAGGSATVGIEDETGTQASKFSYNTRLLANNMAIRFTTLPTSTRQGIHRF